MLDARLRRLIDRPLDLAGIALARRGVGADMLTWGGFAIGASAMAAVMAQSYTLALILLALNRLADGLDGSVARQNRPTDLGGFLDIVLDFIFYAGMVFAFAVADPGTNALAADFDRSARPEVALLSGRARGGHRDDPVPGPGLHLAAVVRAIGHGLCRHVLDHHVWADPRRSSTSARRSGASALNRPRPSAISLGRPSANRAGRRS
jgi:hypothetical protein